MKEASNACALLAVMCCGGALLFMQQDGIRGLYAGGVFLILSIIFARIKKKGPQSETEGPGKSY